MDNASKALIMAGAVLIAVLIVSISMILLRKTDDLVDPSARMLTDQEISSHNSIFIRYEGNGRLGSEAIQALNAVEQHNNNSNKVDKYGTMSVDSPKKNTIKSGKEYNISFSRDDATGVINGITIKEKK